MDPRRFRLALAALGLAGFGARLAYGLVAHVPAGFGDDVWYHEVANGLVHGRGFSDPFNSLQGGRVVFGTLGDAIPTAFHPPLFPAVLALASAVGLDSYTAHQVVGCALGAATVPVVGLIGRRVLDERAGVAAAAIAAVFLPMIARDSLLQSESLYALLVALMLLAALRLHDRQTDRRALALGLAAGLAALTRWEAVLLAALLVVPVAYRGQRGRRARTLALVAAAVAVLGVPWCVRNSLTFDRPVQIATNDGSVFAGANLDSTYHGHGLGAWDYDGLFAIRPGRHLVRNEAVQAERWRDDGIDFARHHLGRLPVVIGARVLRTWDLFPFGPAARARFASDQYRYVHSLEYPSQLMLLAALALAAAGLLALRRGRRLVWPLLAPLGLSVLVSAIAFGDPRFRASADVALVVLAGAGATLGLAALRHRSRTAST